MAIYSALSYSTRMTRLRTHLPLGSDDQRLCQAWANDEDWESNGIRGKDWQSHCADQVEIIISCGDTDWDKPNGDY